MSKLFFMNESSFDIRAMLTMGVSVKEKDNPLGMFGTGMKYSIAIILRLGGTISVLTDGKFYEFVKKTETIRGKDFDCIYIRSEGIDNSINITTHYGVNWEPWMAFRELYSNCMDENGVIAVDYPQDYNTVVSVDCNEIYKAYKNRDQYFIHGIPLFKSIECEIYDYPSSYLFYRGIAVANLEHAGLYTYNILCAQSLTEDRTLKNKPYAEISIKMLVQNDVSGKHLRRIIQASEHTYEGSIVYSESFGVAVEFLDICKELMKQGIGLRESIRLFVQHFDKMLGNFTDIALTKVQQKQLDKAISLLSNMDVPVKEFPIKLVDGLGSGTMGRAHEGTIFLSNIPFNMGTKQVASTLLEEWVHLKYDCEDFDRAMQNWLFDKIISLGEELIGEPV